MYATFWSSSSVPGSAAPARYIANSFSVAPGVSLFRVQPFAENSNVPAWCVRAPGSAIANGG